MTTSAPAANNLTATLFRPSFYFWMTLLMAGFVFGGFGMTYLYPMSAGTFPTAPPVVHVHGLVFFCWMLLLVGQSLLINVRNVALHRSLGMFGIALATLVIMMGAIITLLGAAASRETPSPTYYDGIYLGIMAVCGFAFLFTLALRNTRKPEIHKRLILLAMLPLLPPGIHRLYMVPFGLQTFPIVAMYITLNLLALAILIQEWRSSGRIGKYTIIGVAWLVVQQTLHATILDTVFFKDFIYDLAGMVRYR